jgi:hypothetical protein
MENWKSLVGSSPQFENEKKRVCESKQGRKEEMKLPREDERGMTVKDFAPFHSLYFCFVKKGEKKRLLLLLN